MDKFHEIPMPKTEYQEDMKNSNRSPIELWLEDFTRENSSKHTVSLKSGEVFNSFTTWLITNNMKYEVNCVKFMVRLKNLNINGIETVRGKTSSNKEFDIAKMEVHFGLSPAPHIEEDTDDETVEYEYEEV